MNGDQSTDEEIGIFDSTDLRKYRTEIPNIVAHLGLSPLEFTLYFHLKRTAGAGAGKCWKSTQVLAKECGMSAGSITAAKVNLSLARPELNGKSLIKIQQEKGHSGKPRHIITLFDIWPENFAFFAKQSSPGELQSSSPEFQNSPGEIKKEPIEEDNIYKRPKENFNSSDSVKSPRAMFDMDAANDERFHTQHFQALTDALGLDRELLKMNPRRRILIAGFAVSLSDKFSVDQIIEARRRWPFDGPPEDKYFVSEIPRLLSQKIQPVKRGEGNKNGKSKGYSDGDFTAARERIAAERAALGNAGKGQ